jgi:hypothetical protein
VTDVTVTWPSITSLPVAMSVMRNDTFCTTTILRKKRGNRLYMRMWSLPWRHFRSRDYRSHDFRWRHFRSWSLPVMSLPVAPLFAPPEIWLSVLIYYFCSTQTHYPDSEPTSLWSYSFIITGEATHTNVMLFGLTQTHDLPHLRRTYKHNTTDAVKTWLDNFIIYFYIYAIRFLNCVFYLFQVYIYNWPAQCKEYI